MKLVMSGKHVTIRSPTIRNSGGSNALLYVGGDDVPREMQRKIDGSVGILV